MHATHGPLFQEGVLLCTINNVYKQQNRDVLLFDLLHFLPWKPALS